MGPTLTGWAGRAGLPGGGGGPPFPPAIHSSVIYHRLICINLLFINNTIVYIDM